LVTATIVAGGLAEIECADSKSAAEEIGVRPIPICQASTKKTNPHFRLMDLYSWKSSYVSSYFLLL